ncbi:hypothetical protein [Arthrobacter sp. KNU40]|uniref:hypothetical protein n=1 Tax=Arthrobacter sp. KNU40 TaxID=3447965 RepID=UPI003F609C0F
MATSLLAIIAAGAPKGSFSTAIYSQSRAFEQLWVFILAPIAAAIFAAILLEGLSFNPMNQQPWLRQKPDPSENLVPGALSFLEVGKVV